MGGHALKTTTTRRYQAEEFYTLWDEIRNLLLTNTFVASRPLGLIKSYDAKESHGDMDILIGVYTKEEQQDLVKQIEELLQPTEIFENSNVISMDYKKLQIDFCFIDVRLYNLCWHFFAYNDHTVS